MIVVFNVISSVKSFCGNSEWWVIMVLVVYDCLNGLVILLVIRLWEGECDDVGGNLLLVVRFVVLWLLFCWDYF